jgi:hypothetical protein
VNIRRGLNRLFVVSAIAWYILAGAILWPKWQAALNAKQADWATPAKPYGGVRTATPPTPDEILASLPPEHPIKQTFIFLVIPPATYLFAAVLVWVARGFSADLA